MHAGVSTRDITPDVGVSLSGFGHGRRSTSLRDRLQAQALALVDTTGTPAVLVSTDLLAMTSEQIAEIQARVLSKHPRAFLLITHSHTHSGPSIGMLRDTERASHDYLSGLVNSVAEAAIEAIETALPAQLQAGTGTCELGVNRRVRTPGGVVFGPNQDGPCDRGVAVLRVNAVDGAPIACWFRVAAHPVTLDGRHTCISGDWPGEAARILAEELGYPCVLFAQGCCGDVNPTVEPGEQGLLLTARRAADAAKNAFGTTTYLASGEWHTAARAVDLPTVRPLRHDELPARLEVRALRLDGSLTLVGLSTEPFSSIAQDVQARMPHTQTRIVLGYTNGCFGYLPDPEAFVGPAGQRGYEVDEAPHWFRTPTLAPEAYTVAIDTVAEVVASV